MDRRTGIGNSPDCKWSKPSPGVLKCNVSSSWVGSRYHFSGDFTGSAVYHARDAFCRLKPVNSRALMCPMESQKFERYSCGGYRNLV